MWKLQACYCISCGKDLGIRMTQTEHQEYFYCSRCHINNHIAKDVDLETVYNNLHIERPLGSKYPEKCPTCGSEILYLMQDSSIKCANSFCRFVFPEIRPMEYNEKK